MKKITICVDDTTLARLEVLRYYFSSTNSALIRRAVYNFEESIRGTSGYIRAVDMYHRAHSDDF